MTMTTNDHAIIPTKNGNDDDNGEHYQHGKPYEGMCCLCTMEDITEEDGNYGERERERAAR